MCVSKCVQAGNFLRRRLLLSKCLVRLQPGNPLKSYVGELSNLFVGVLLALFDRGHCGPGYRAELGQAGQRELAGCEIAGSELCGERADRRRTDSQQGFGCCLPDTAVGIAKRDAKATAADDQSPVAAVAAVASCRKRAAATSRTAGSGSFKALASAGTTSPGNPTCTRAASEAALTLASGSVVAAFCNAGAADAAVALSEEQSRAADSRLPALSSCRGSSMAINRGTRRFGRRGGAP